MLQTLFHFLLDLDASEMQLNGRVKPLVGDSPDGVHVGLAGEVRHLQAYKY